MNLKEVRLHLIQEHHREATADMVKPLTSSTCPFKVDDLYFSLPHAVFVVS